MIRPGWEFIAHLNVAVLSVGLIFFFLFICVLCSSAFPLQATGHILSILVYHMLIKAYSEELYQQLISMLSGQYSNLIRFVQWTHTPTHTHIQLHSFILRNVEENITRKKVRGAVFVSGPIQMAFLTCWCFMHNTFLLWFLDNCIKVMLPGRDTKPTVGQSRGAGSSGGVV